jgi:hypothetical protein
VKHLTKLEIKETNEGSYSLTSPFVVTHDGIRYKVPEGFPTDLATIPWPVTVFLPQDGPYKASAVFHDFLLEEMYAGRLDISRTKASRLFYLSLRYEKIPLVKSLVLYSGVRLKDLQKYIEKKL